MLFWIAAYTTLQTFFSQAMPTVMKKKWPLSSYIVSLIHQTCILPYLYVHGHTQECFVSSIGYFLSDAIANYPYFDTWLLLHHAVSIALLINGLYFLPPPTLALAATWLLSMEIGSAALNLTDMTNQFYTFRIVVYGLTRAVVIWQMVFVLLYDERESKLVCLISFPLVAHNVRVFTKMYHSYQRTTKQTSFSL